MVAKALLSATLGLAVVWLSLQYGEVAKLQESLKTSERERSNQQYLIDALRERRDMLEREIAALQSEKEYTLELWQSGSPFGPGRTVPVDTFHGESALDSCERAKRESVVAIGSPAFLNCVRKR